VSGSPSIWIASHGPLGCNSGLHVRSLALALAEQGFRIRVLLPERRVEDAALEDGLDVAGFDEAVKLVAADPPDLLHLWTARERMVAIERRLAHRSPRAIPHLVHLEDNEELLLREQMRLSAEAFAAVRRGERGLEVPEHLTHPRHGFALIERAAGVTALIEPLVEQLPAAMPRRVFLPGFDPAFAEPDPDAGDAVRSRLRIPESTLIAVYTGNVHESNVSEVRSLYLAVALANRMGLPMRLVRTGLDFVPLAEHGEDLLRAHAHELGFVDRELLPRLVHAADFLVQPGRADAWNRFRVPSKLPDFLVSGRAVVLPRVNLGERLADGVEAIVLGSAAAEDLLECFVHWAKRPEERRRVGERGAAFARRHLSWQTAAVAVGDLCREVLGAGASWHGAAPEALGAAR
jgi:glycosyltransferase involved in cell wall biosynthesis